MTSADFITSARDGIWAEALHQISSGLVSSSLVCQGNSVFNWLIEIDAPTEVVLALTSHCIAREGIDANELGMLDACLRYGAVRQNAFPTFCGLLKLGLSPNVITPEGETLVQKAMRLNCVREVREMLRYAIDPHRKNVFGLESTTNLQDARTLDNESARLFAQYFSEAT